jgi:nucleotide-binding universal stress UspA family protein
VFRKILVGLDGSDAAYHALTRALELARLVAGEVHVLSVQERLPAYASTVGEIDAEVEYQNTYYADVQAKAREQARVAGVPLSGAVQAGHPAELLVREAREGAFDLVVIGHTGHSRLHNLFLGSTADRVVEHAPCPVLVVR